MFYLFLKHCFALRVKGSLIFYYLLSEVLNIGLLLNGLYRLAFFNMLILWLNCWFVFIVMYFRLLFAINWIIDLKFPFLNFLCNVSRPLLLPLISKILFRLFTI